MQTRPLSASGRVDTVQIPNYLLPHTTFGARCSTPAPAPRQCKANHTNLVYFSAFTFGNTIGFLRGSETTLRLPACCCFVKSLAMAFKSQPNFFA